MPLPKPPATRASRVSPTEFEAQPLPRVGTGMVSRVQPRLLCRWRRLPAVGEEAPRRSARNGSPPVAREPARSTLPSRPCRPRQRHVRGRATPDNGPAKLFVLDTNVLMHDPMSLFRFEEHDVFLPMITLEETRRPQHGA